MFPLFVVTDFSQTLHTAVYLELGLPLSPAISAKYVHTSETVFSFGTIVTEDLIAAIMHTVNTFPTTQFSNTVYSHHVG